MHKRELMSDFNFLSCPSTTSHTFQLNRGIISNFTVNRKGSAQEKNICLGFMFQDISSRQETQIFSKKSDKHIQEMLRWRSFQDLPDEEMSHHERKRSLEERKRQVEEEARRSSLEEQRRLHLRKEEEKRISLEAEVGIKAKITLTSINASRLFSSIPSPSYSKWACHRILQELDI